MIGEMRVQVHGHRGARALRPENTIPAFRYAIEQGVDFVELDVLVTKDGIVVVTHDPHINSVICGGPNPALPFATSPARNSANTIAARYDTLRSRNRCRPPARPFRRLTRYSRSAPETQSGSTSSPKFTPAPPELFAELILDVIRRHDLIRRVLLQSFDPQILACHREA